MRVKIAYTIDAEELNDTVYKLLQETKIRMYAATQELENSLAFLSTANSVEVIAKLDTCRRSLYKIDARLEDCAELLDSYNKAVVQAAMAAKLETEPIEKEKEIGNQDDRNI